MKKSLIVTLILVFMLSIAGTAFAAAITNPFVDVPAKHWSYDAIKKLAAAGIIEGADNKFYGDKTLTRYEIAVIVAKALAQEEKADAEQRALIEKLAAEYTAELQSIGVRLSAVEAKADKVQIMGYLGFRYDWEKGAGVQTEAAHLDVTTNYKVDDKTTISLNSLFHQGLRDSSNLDNSSSTNTWTKAAKVVCVNTSIDDKVALTAGAFKFNPAYAMVTSDNDNQGSVVKGLQATFGGDVIKTTLFSGKTTGAYGLFSSNSNGSKYNAAELDFAVSKNTNIKTAYHKTPDVNYYEAGFDTKVAKDLVFTAATAKSDVDVDHNQGYFAQLTYKQAAFWAVPHSYDLYVAYHDIPTTATINGGSISDFYGNYNYNFRGFTVGGQYVFSRMIMLTSWYSMGKTIDTNADQKVFRTQLDFFF